MERLCREVLYHIDLTPKDARPVPPFGLCTVAKPGDHIARKLADEPYWHHGRLWPTLGSFMVIDNYPSGSD